MRKMIALCVAAALQAQPVLAADWCRKPVEENNALPGTTATFDGVTLIVSEGRCSADARPTYVHEYHCPGLLQSIWPDTDVDMVFATIEDGELWLIPDTMIRSELMFIPCPDTKAIM